MMELYVEVWDDHSGSHGIRMPVESAVTIFALHYCGADVKPTLVCNQSEEPGVVAVVPFESHRLQISAVDCDILDCRFPVLKVGNNEYVAGLAAILRSVIKRCANLRSLKLLGFRGGCLSACAEVSTWTHFCEVDFPEAVRRLHVNGGTVPADLVRFERHLEQPVRVHNVGKVRAREERALNGNQDQNGDLQKGSVSNSEQGYNFSANCGKENSDGHPVTVQDGLPQSGFVANDATQDVKYAQPAGSASGSQNGRRKLQVQHDVQHTYAEGPDLTLSDVMLLPCVEISMRHQGGPQRLSADLPLVCKWLATMRKSPYACSAMEVLRMVPTAAVGSQELSVPIVPNESLYKSDPKRYQPRSRLFTRQQEVEETLLRAPDDDVLLGFTQPEQQQWRWDLMPPEVHPKGGSLPASRLERKCGQLESMCKATIGLAECHRKKKKKLQEKQEQTEVTIVDFCSGGGHVGLILAHLLPWAKVVLVENKEESMAGAKSRSGRLGLTNVRFYQSNLSYYQGAFEVGVALHACGTATDLVLHRCKEACAAFVVSPCCYGAVRSSLEVPYPRSCRFRYRSRIGLKEYLTLAHAADQTHGENGIKTEQGKRCMKIVDSDRLIGMREVGYRVRLMKLMPPGCTPKDHMLVGWWSKGGQRSKGEGSKEEESTG